MIPVGPNSLKATDGDVVVRYVLVQPCVRKHVRLPVLPLTPDKSCELTDPTLAEMKRGDIASVSFSP